ncbi:MAG: transcriptional repressor [Clostridiales bacterium]|nr:transcriptional repressor [Clostridiales bacterium]
MRYRALILQQLRQCDGHPTAEQLYLQVKEVQPAIAMATVYNNLAALVQDGQIRRVRIPDQADRYDKTMTPHDHLICDRCGRLADIQLGNFSETLEERLGIPVESYDLSVHYICPDCRDAESQSA